MSSCFALVKVDGRAGWKKGDRHRNAYHVPVARYLHECLGRRWSGRRKRMHPLFRTCLGIEGWGLDGWEGKMVGCAVMVGE